MPDVWVPAEISFRFNASNGMMAVDRMKALLAEFKERADNMGYPMKIDSVGPEIDQTQAKK